MADTPATPPPVLPDFRDRRTGLIVFGILQVVLGSVAALMIPVTVLVQVMAADLTRAPVPVRQIIPGTFLWGVVGVALVSLGIGSCNRRRWARALSLVVSWSWLLLGVITTGTMAFLLPRILNPSQAPGAQLPEPARVVALMVSLLFLSLFTIALPCVLVLFYQSRHVKATCETHDTTVRWTDACPLPVLALSLWTAFGAATMLLLSLSSHPVLPLFGRLLVGAKASVCCIGVALVWGYCAYALFRLRTIGWWVSLLSFGAAALSAWTTFSRVSVVEMYRATGFPERQIDIMRQFSFLQDDTLAYVSLTSIIPMLALLVFVRTCFSPTGPRNKQASPTRAPVLGLGVGVVVVAFLVLFHARQPAQFPQRLWSVCFSPDGNLLVTGGGPDSPDSQPQAGELVLWDARTGQPKRIVRQKWGVRSVAFSPDGAFVAMADFGGMTRLVDPANGQSRAELRPHPRHVNAVAISPDGQVVAGGSFDGTISLWDPAGTEVRTVETPDEQILNVALSPGGQRLVATCRGGNAYLFDLARREPPKVLEAYVGEPSYWSGVEAVAFAPDAKSFVTGGMTLRLWETETGNLVRELQGANARVNCMAFSPDGRSLAGVDRDGWLRIWDPFTGDSLRLVRAHQGPSFGLAFSPDGRRLATVARNDFVVKIWNSQTLELLATFNRSQICL